MLKWLESWMLWLRWRWMCRKEPDKINEPW